MGTTPPTTEKPLLSRRKAVRNLKDLAPSSATQIKSEPENKTTQSFSPAEQIIDEDSFPYENLKDNIGKKINNYFFSSLGAYIYFACVSNKENDTSETEKPVKVKRSIFAAKKQETGWKLHISVDSSQISLAWAIIYPILMENEISAKILEHDVLKRKAIEEISSKQLTIYEFKNRHIDSSAWNNVIQKIENELRQHGIRKGIEPKSNKQIPNSEYFSYRNDTDPTGKYISDGAAQRYVAMHLHEDPQLRSYNLTKDKDPFEEVMLQIDLNQDHIERKLNPS